MAAAGHFVTNYNIPSNNRELQREVRTSKGFTIITYQVITGNYNCRMGGNQRILIITYQVITGNYNRF